jgi:50S ribosomal subunit-associated GTPase HflX
LCTNDQLTEAQEIVHLYSPFESIPVSSITSQGIDELRSGIMTMLHGPPIKISVIPPDDDGGMGLVELVARVHREALVIEVKIDSKSTRIYGWMGKANIARLTKDHPGQIQISI